MTRQAISRLTRLQHRRTAQFEKKEKLYAKRSQSTAKKLTRLRRTRDELTELRRTYKEVHAQILPKWTIQHLPHEIMLEIFSMAITESNVLFDSLDVLNNALWILSHVCLGWRAIVLSNPLLWSSLWTDDSNAEEEQEWSPERALLWELALERSHPLPIHVQHIGINSNSISVAFQATRKFSARLETISINMVNWPEPPSDTDTDTDDNNMDVDTDTDTDTDSDIGTDPDIDWQDMDLPLLTTFALEVEVVGNPYTKPFANLMGFLGAPHLKTVELRGIYHDPKHWQLSNSTASRLAVGFSDTECLALYFGMQSLIEAELHASTVGWAPPTKPITSTSLRRLSVYYDGDTLFSHIRCPLLQMLRIEGWQSMPSSLPKFLCDTQVATLVVHIPCCSHTGPLPHHAENLFASIRACSDRLCVLSIDIHRDFASEFYTLLTRREGHLTVAPHLEELYLYDHARKWRPIYPPEPPSAFETPGLVGMVATRPQLHELVLCAQRFGMSHEMKEVVRDLVALSTHQLGLNFVVHWGYMWTNPRHGVFT
ncbi:hypothetical protein CYLTODRAFT_417120 [Cylindrobasidium torrendii FP15055 ss-10]|uniref:F-box domain-containing protein n=1 Tax=Cylindrobasidium torrendii FP15055 ss-10 TaxID=1314674 RepID=A0A0D7BSR1_9AGAR|nr:hypothetical protein CYLTODRAFT_417120 [Cylindrobasidium torrendii FP15055 ss-10]